ncbi:zinc transport system substrate-binding protein [Lachnospiraceae bacterium XBB1006]|nr:zinc transport system substrate-binding protein [Lachnospiraceae bacterium XBB1006]
MRNKYLYSLLMMGVIGALVVLFTIRFGEKKESLTNEKLTIVTSFYPMYVATQNLVSGVEGIHLKNLSEPETGCLHDFQLTPEDMKLLSKADVFVVNGSGAENFLQDVMKEYPKLITINATETMDDMSEEVGMHAWMSPRLYKKQIMRIAHGLKEVCPKQKDRISKNAARYAKKVEALCKQVDELKELYAARGQSHVILFSEAYEGLVEDMGLSVSYLMDLDEERQVSSGEVAEVMEAVAKEAGVMILAEAPYGKNLGDMVHKETNTPVVYLDTLTRGAYDEQRYLTGMAKNLQEIKEALDETD